MQNDSFNHSFPKDDNPNMNTKGNPNSTRKNRKLNRTGHQLKRNSACIPCRRRRIKCDAGKPHCGSCIRSFQFLSRTQPDKERDNKGILCFYDDVDADGEGEVDGEGEEDDEDMELEIQLKESNKKKKKRKDSGMDDDTKDDQQEEHMTNWVDSDLKEVHFERGKMTLEQLEARVAELQKALESTSGSIPPPALALGIAPNSNPNPVIAPLSSSFITSSTSSEAIQQPMNVVPNDFVQYGMSSSNRNLYPQASTSHIVAPLASYSVSPAGNVDSNLVQNNTVMGSSSIRDPQIQSTSINLDLDLTVGTLNSPGHDNGKVPVTQAQYRVVVEDQGDVDDSTIQGASGLLNDDGELDREAGRLGGLFLDVIWPGWPPSLPTPALLDHLVHIFFTKVPFISRLIHQPQFITRLQLPPRHPDFPHTALLHAICAVSARYTAAVKTSTTEESIARTDQEQGLNSSSGSSMKIEDEISDITCFAERNFRYAQLHAKPEGLVGRKLFEVVQSMVLGMYFCQQHAKWITAHMLCGLATRGIMPLNLMRDPQTDPNNPVSLGIRGNSLLPDALEDWDREERRALMFFVFLFDAFMSSSSGWAPSLMTDEVYTHLPCSREDFARGGQIQRNPQTLHSHNIWTKHPIEDSFLMCIKGAWLATKVNKYMRKVKNADPDDRFPMRDSLEFIQLDKDIATFLHHFPSSMRDVLRPLYNQKKGIDSDLVLAHFLPHLATILLHEPFADLSEPSNVSATRLASASRACLSIMHNLINSSLDLSLFLSPTISCDGGFVAARTLCLFYQRALETGDKTSARMILCEIDVFRLAAQSLSSRFALGIRSWGMVEAILRRIDSEYGGDSTSVVLSIFPQHGLPPQHPDSVYARSSPQVPFRDILDRKRGYVRREGSLSSHVSPSNPSPGSGSTSGSDSKTAVGSSISQRYGAQLKVHGQSQTIGLNALQTSQTSSKAEGYNEQMSQGASQASHFPLDLLPPRNREGSGGDPQLSAPFVSQFVQQPPLNSFNHPIQQGLENNTSFPTGHGYSNNPNQIPGWSANATIPPAISNTGFGSMPMAPGSFDSNRNMGSNMINQTMIGQSSDTSQRRFSCNEQFRTFPYSTSQQPDPLNQYLSQAQGSNHTQTFITEPSNLQSIDQTLNNSINNGNNGMFGAFSNTVVSGQDGGVMYDWMNWGGPASVTMGWLNEDDRAA